MHESLLKPCLCTFPVRVRIEKSPTMESINALKIIVQHPNKSGNAGGVMRALCQDCMLPEAPPTESDAGSQTKTIATGRVTVC